MRPNLIVLLLGFILFQSCKKDNDSKNYFVDNRDNVSYRLIDIGNQKWMAENLRYRGPELTLGNGSDSISIDASPLYYFIYKDSEKYYDKYGCLYTLMAAQIACPQGWHLPTDDEWKELERSLGMTEKDVNGLSWRGENQGSLLKEKGTSGFNALMSGYRSNTGGFYSKEELTVFWNLPSSVKDSTNHRALYKSMPQIQRDAAKNGNGFCVRCVKDK